MTKFFLITIIALLSLPLISGAQTCCGTPPPPAPPPIDPGTSVPFDGGLTVLLAAGAAFGLKRVKNGKVKSLPSGADDNCKHHQSFF